MEGISGTTPTRSGERSETVDPETERIILERLANAEKDAETAVDARKAVSEIRKNLQHPKSR